VKHVSRKDANVSSPDAVGTIERGHGPDVSAAEINHNRVLRMEVQRIDRPTGNAGSDPLEFLLIIPA
jgi:hypothetical protein